MGQYRLSALEYHVLLLALILPSIVVWVAAFYSYAKLEEYARSVMKTSEGPAFARLATGLKWLAWSLPITAIVTLVFSSISSYSPGFHSTAIIITNYLSLGLPLVAFSIIGTASRAMVEHAKLSLSSASIRSILIIFITGGVLYCYFTFSNFNLTSLGSTNNPYYLPAWLLVVSIVIPYLYAWFVGLLAAYEINSFSNNVSGLFYRRPLRLLAGGLWTVIFSSVALQYSSTLAPNIDHLLLNYHLILISIFKIIGGVGYLMIALGASRLKKIEDI